MYIDEPCTEYSPLDRDRLFQAYCVMKRSNPSERYVRDWIAAAAETIVSKITRAPMSPERAKDIIGQGCGAWDSPNSMWWRGVSVP